MSLEQAQAFIERMKADEAFREKVMAIEDAAGRLAFIQSEGFECTVEELNEAAGSGNDVSAGACKHLCTNASVCTVHSGLLL